MAATYKSFFDSKVRQWAILRPAGGPTAADGPDKTAIRAKAVTKPPQRPSAESCQHLY